MEKGLAGDTAPVQADTADSLLLDNGDVEAELGSANRGDVTAGTGADDCDIVLRHATRLSRQGERRGPARRRGRSYGRRVRDST